MSISAQQFRDLLDRYLNGTASPKERELLDKFFESYHTGLSDPGVLENNQQLQQEILQKIYRRIAFEQKPAGNRMLRLWLPMAACMLLFVLSYFFMDSRVLPPAEQHAAPVMMEEKTSQGEKLSVKLPDGTSVYLNAGSKISYPESFDEKSRDVTITGEVYFEDIAATDEGHIKINGKGCK